MADIEQAEIEYTLQKINYVMQAMNNDDQLSVLQETDLLLKIIPKKNKPEIITLSNDINNILLDDDKMRIIKLLRKVKIDDDSGAEYYDSDRGNDPKLDYQTSFEKEMNLLNDKIRNCLSVIIKEKIGETRE